MGTGRPFPNLWYGNPNVMLIPVPEREERSPSQQFRAVLMRGEAVQRAGPPKEGSRPCRPGLWMSFLVSVEREVSPWGGRGVPAQPQLLASV